MGSPTPPGGPVGDNCGNCDGVLWPTGVTPKFVQLELAGLIKCPLCPFDAPNGLWWLEQRIAAACKWDLIYGPYEFNLVIGGAVTDLIVASPTMPPGWTWFAKNLAGCQFDLPNDVITCAGLNASKDGTAHIFWPGP